MTWYSSYDCALRYVSRQMELVATPHKLTFIHLLISVEDYLGVKNDCRHIDEMLTSSNFPLLDNVRLHVTFPPDYFPMLKNRGILVVGESGERP